MAAEDSVSAEFPRVGVGEQRTDRFDGKHDADDGEGGGDDDHGSRLGVLGIDGMLALGAKPPDQDGGSGQVGEDCKPGCEDPEAVVEHSGGYRHRAGGRAKRPPKPSRATALAGAAAREGRGPRS